MLYSKENNIHNKNLRTPFLTFSSTQIIFLKSTTAQNPPKTPNTATKKEFEAFASIIQALEKQQCDDIEHFKTLLLSMTKSEASTNEMGTDTNKLFEELNDFLTKNYPTHSDSISDENLIKLASLLNSAQLDDKIEELLKNIKIIKSGQIQIQNLNNTPVVATTEPFSDMSNEQKIQIFNKQIQESQDSVESAKTTIQKCLDQNLSVKLTKSFMDEEEENFKKSLRATKDDEIKKLVVKIDNLNTQISPLTEIKRKLKAHIRGSYLELQQTLEDVKNKLNIDASTATVNGSSNALDKSKKAFLDELFIAFEEFKNSLKESSIAEVNIEVQHSFLTTITDLLKQRINEADEKFSNPPRCDENSISEAKNQFEEAKEKLVTNKEKVYQLTFSKNLTIKKLQKLNEKNILATENKKEIDSTIKNLEETAVENEKKKDDLQTELKSAVAELKQLQTEISECNSSRVKDMQSLNKLQEELEIAQTEVEEAEKNLEDAKNYKEIAVKKFDQLEYSESAISIELNLITVKLENLEKEDNFNNLVRTLTDQMKEISNDEIRNELHSDIERKSKIQALEIRIEANKEWIKQLNDKKEIFLVSECYYENKFSVKSTQLESAKKNLNLNHNVLSLLIDSLREKNILENIKHQIHGIENNCSIAETRREILDNSLKAETENFEKNKKEKQDPSVVLNSQITSLFQAYHKAINDKQAFNEKKMELENQIIVFNQVVKEEEEISQVLAEASIQLNEKPECLKRRHNHKIIKRKHLAVSSKLGILEFNESQKNVESLTDSLFECDKNVKNSLEDIKGLESEIQQTANDFIKLMEDEIEEFRLTDKKFKNFVVEQKTYLSILEKEMDEHKTNLSSLQKEIEKEEIDFHGIIGNNNSDTSLTAGQFSIYEKKIKDKWTSIDLKYAILSVKNSEIEALENRLKPLEDSIKEHASNLDNYILKLNSREEKVELAKSFINETLKKKQEFDTMLKTDIENFQMLSLEKLLIENEIQSAEENYKSRFLDAFSQVKIIAAEKQHFKLFHRTTNKIQSNRRQDIIKIVSQINTNLEQLQNLQAKQANVQTKVDVTLKNIESFQSTYTQNIQELTNAKNESETRISATKNKIKKLKKEQLTQEGDLKALQITQQSSQASFDQAEQTLKDLLHKNDRRLTNLNELNELNTQIESILTPKSTQQGQQSDNQGIEDTEKIRIQALEVLKQKIDSAIDNNKAMPYEKTLIQRIEQLLISVRDSIQDLQSKLNSQALQNYKEALLEILEIKLSHAKKKLNNTPIDSDQNTPIDSDQPDITTATNINEKPKKEINSLKEQKRIVELPEFSLTFIDKQIIDLDNQLKPAKQELNKAKEFITQIHNHIFSKEEKIGLQKLCEQKVKIKIQEIHEKITSFIDHLTILSVDEFNPSQNSLKEGQILLLKSKIERNKTQNNDWISLIKEFFRNISIQLNKVQESDKNLKQAVNEAKEKGLIYGLSTPHQKNSIARESKTVPVQPGSKDDISKHSTQSSSSHPKWIYIVCGIVAVVAIGGGLFFIFIFPKKTHDTLQD